MADITTPAQSPAQSPDQLPQPLTIPTQVAEDGNSVAVGYTESNPVGPDQSPAANDGDGLIAGKFKSVADLEKAYKELASRMGQTKQSTEQPAEQSGEQPTETEPVPDAEKVAAIATTEEATTLLKDKGLNINAFTAEFERTGQLSQESYDKLNAAGIPPETVNAYIDGQRVLAASQIAEVKNSVGGEAEYAKLIEWASVNLNADEKAAYQRILESGSLPAIKFAASGLSVRYHDAMGKDPQTVIAGAAGNGNDGRDRFASREEMVAAMQDERYAKDPAYRARVERKVFNSSL